MDFRDTRKVFMPSGKTWSTHARHISDEFDILAVNLYNITGNIRDFAFVSRENFPKYKARKKDEIYPMGDQIRMECDFFDLSLKLTPAITTHLDLIFN